VRQLHASGASQLEKFNAFILRTVFTLRGDQKGVTALEYGLIAGLVFIAIVASVTLFGSHLGVLFNKVSNNVATATS
jgi:pilus assembly protein Flp/PilA